MALVDDGTTWFTQGLLCLSEPTKKDTERIAPKRKKSKIWGPYCGWTKSISLKERWFLMISWKCQQTMGFQHGFQSGAGLRPSAVGVLLAEKHGSPWYMDGLKNPSKPVEPMPWLEKMGSLWAALSTSPFPNRLVVKRISQKGP